MKNFMAIGGAVVEIWRFIDFFQNGGRQPSWVNLTYIGTTHKEYLVVFIVVQNLVGIDAVVLII